MIEVSADEFVREHSVGEPREFQQLAGRWLDALMAHGNGPHVKVGAAEIGVFDALRSEILLRTGNALRDAAMLDAVRRRHPRGAIRITGQLATPSLRRLGGALGAQWLDVSGAPWTAWPRELAYTARSAVRRLGKRSSRVSGSPEILAVPRLPGQLTDMLPVVRLLERKGVSTAFAAPAIAAEIEASGQTLLKLGGEAMPRAIIAAPLLALRCEAVAAAAPEATNPVAARWALRQVLASNLLEVVWFSISLGRLVQEHRPRVVLVGNPYTMEGRVAARLARANGVAAACLEHGSIFSDDPIWADCPLDEVLVWGEPSRRALLSCGVPPEAVVIVGAPRLDEFARLAAGDKPRSILVATSGPGDQVSLDTHLRFVETLFAAAADLPGVKVVVKLHPKDSPGHYRTAQERHPRANVELVIGARDRQGIDIFEFLSRARAMVTVTSTAALDAMAVNVPVVAVLDGPAERYAHIEFLARGCTTRVSTPGQLRAALQAALDGTTPAATVEAARNYAEEHYAHRGEAAARAADALMKLGARQGPLHG